MIAWANSIAASWWSWIAPLSIQVAALAALVWLVDLGLRKRGWPQVRYALWLLVFAKLILPPSFALPTSISAPLVAIFVGGAQIAPAEPVALIPPAAGVGGVFLGEPAALLVPAVPPAQINAAPAPSVAPAAPPSAPRFWVLVSWKAWVMLVWALGIIGMFLYLAVRVHSFTRALKGSCEPIPTQFEAALRRAAARLSLRRLPRVVVTDAVSGAAAFGVFRPVILLPEACRETLSEGAAEHVLLHELSHMKRGDLVVNALQTVLALVFWFNPTLWLAARRCRHLRELCCDATVANILRDDTSSYRATLIEEAKRILIPNSTLGLGLLGLFESPARLRARLEHLSGPIWKNHRRRVVAAAIALVIMALCVVPMARSSFSKAPEPATSLKSQDLFRRTLSSGVTVELVGVSTHPSSPNTWWRPDATTLEEAPCDPPATRLSGVEGAGARLFAVRVKGKDVETPRLTWEVIPQGRFAASWIPVKNGKTAGGLRAFGVVIPEDVETAKVRVGVGEGPWTVRAMSEKGGGKLGTGEGGAVLTPPVQELGKVEITVMDDFAGALERRIVALDRHGRPHEGSQEILRQGKMIQVTTWFDGSVHELKSYRFETRPCEWVEFDGVSLGPNPVAVTAPTAKTPERVKRSESENPFRKTLSNSATVELVGVSIYPSTSTSWWRPDGTSLVGAPYDRFEPDGVMEQEEHREMAVRVEPQDVGVEDVSVSIEPLGGIGIRTPVKNDTRVKGMIAITYNMPESQSATVRVAVPTGPWHTIATSQGSSQKEMRSADGSAVIFYAASETGDGTRITVSHETTHTGRVVAVTKSAATLAATSRSTNTLGGLSRTAVVFQGVKIKDIDHFEYQTRPYETAEFKDVALNPHKDIAPVPLSAPSPAASAESAATPSAAAPTTGPAASTESQPKPQTATITGTVLDENGMPAVGIDITAYNGIDRSRKGNGPHEPQPPVTVKTSLGGYFKFDLPCVRRWDDWCIIVRTPATNSATIRTSGGIGTASVGFSVEDGKVVTGGGGVLQPLSVRCVAAPGKVAGTLVDSDGRPVSGAVASIRKIEKVAPEDQPSPGNLDVGGVPDAWRLFETRTNENGQFTVGGLPRGSNTRVEFKADGLAHLSEEYAVDGDQKTVILQPEAKVTGKVVSNDPAIGVSGVMLIIHCGENEREYEGFTKSAADGGFSFSGIPAGNYNLRALGSADDSWVGLATVPIKIEAGKTSQAAVELVRTLSIRGRVIDKATGKGMAGAIIGASGPDRYGMVRTDADGRYDLKVAPGKYYLDLRLSVDPSSFSRLWDVVADPGKDLDLPDVEVLDGKIVSRQGGTYPPKTSPAAPTPANPPAAAPAPTKAPENPPAASDAGKPVVTVASDTPEPEPEDTADVPSQDLRAGGDESKRYLLFGPKVGGEGPKDGLGLVVVMPGGDGSDQFRWFVKRVWKFALASDYLAAEPVAPKWNFNQNIVWPTAQAGVFGQKFTTEEFVEAVIADVAGRYKIDRRRVFLLAWSSGGPAAYATALQSETQLTGAFVAMSVFKPESLPALSAAKGRRFYIYHSSDDTVCPLWMAETARDSLVKEGAQVEFAKYTGGHGWTSPDVYGDIRKGIEWLEKSGGNSGN